LISFDDELMWENQSSPRILVNGGYSSAGEPIYICRFWVTNQALVPGKLHNNRCYVPFGGTERSSNDWETLKYRYLKLWDYAYKNATSVSKEGDYSRYEKV
jgi:hypothetical protein